MAPNVQTIRTFLQDHTGYHVQTDGLLRLAFDATVNKRLAMEGDAVLKFALIDDWYTTDASTGKRCLDTDGERASKGTNEAQRLATTSSLP